MNHTDPQPNELISPDLLHFSSMDLFDYLPLIKTHLKKNNHDKHLITAWVDRQSWDKNDQGVLNETVCVMRWLEVTLLSI